MKKIEMPAGARYIIEQLNNSGYEAFIVGGCVRDSLLGKNPSDWDITTSATPYQVKEIFGRTIDTGIQHGTVTVLVDRKITGNTGDAGITSEYAFEVTTYRVDGIYEDHRRPKEVSFTSNLEEDLKRRDFTINAMAYNDEQGVIDIFGGVEDLKSGIVKCVGNPSDRFDEDALRILRAVRFAAQLNFKIEEETQIAMKKQCGFLKDISAERIQVELTKLIMSDHPEKLVDAYELGLTAIILPEFDEMMSTPQNNPYHLYNVGLHTIKVMENIPKNMVLRYTALLHDSGKPETRRTDDNGIDHFYGHQELSAKKTVEVLRRLKLDNNTIDSTKKLVLYHDYGISDKVGQKAFRRFLSKLGVENFKDFIAIRTADLAGQSKYNAEKSIENIAHMEAMFEKITRENHCLNLKDMAIGGKDLLELGMKPGKAMGQVLHLLLEEVLDEPGKNNREDLLKIVKEKYL